MTKELFDNMAVINGEGYLEVTSSDTYSLKIRVNKITYYFIIKESKITYDGWDLDTQPIEKLESGIYEKTNSIN